MVVLDVTTPYSPEAVAVFLGSASMILPNNGYLQSVNLRAGYSVNEFYGNSFPVIYKQTFNF